MMNKAFFKELGATFMSFIIVLTLCLGFSTAKMTYDHQTSAPEYTVVASVE